MGAFSPWHLLIVALVILVLFGSTKLPGFARSIGRSMRIFKSEVKGLQGEDEEAEGKQGTDKEKREAQDAEAQELPESSTTKQTASEQASERR